MNKPIKFANGNRIANGQLNLARDGGREKHTGPVPLAHGAKRQTHGVLHPYLHSQALADGGVPEKLDGKAVPPHDSVNHSFGQPRTMMPSDHGSKHLRAASRLSARDAQKSKDEGFDHSFIGHRVGGQSLPASK